MKETCTIPTKHISHSLTSISKQPIVYLQYLLNNYGVALLPGTDFYFQKHELFFRLAFVDFDGESVINSYANFDGTDEEFVITNCSSIYRGVAQIIQCVKDL